MSPYQFSRDEAKFLNWLQAHAYGRENARQVSVVVRGLGWGVGPHAERRARTMKNELVANAGVLIGNVSDDDPKGWYLCDPDSERDLETARQSVEDQVRPQLAKLLTFSRGRDDVLRIVESLVDDIEMKERL